MTKPSNPQTRNPKSEGFVTTLVWEPPQLRETSEAGNERTSGSLDSEDSSNPEHVSAEQHGAGVWVSSSVSPLMSLEFRVGGCRKT